MCNGDWEFHSIEVGGVTFTKKINVLEERESKPTDWYRNKADEGQIKMIMQTDGNLVASRSVSHGPHAYCDVM